MKKLQVNIGDKFTTLVIKEIYSKQQNDISRKYGKVSKIYLTLKCDYCNFEFDCRKEYFLSKNDFNCNNCIRINRKKEKEVKKLIPKKNNNRNLNVGDKFGNSTLINFDINQNKFTVECNCGEKFDVAKKALTTHKFRRLPLSCYYCKYNLKIGMKFGPFEVIELSSCREIYAECVCGQVETFYKLKLERINFDTCQHSLEINIGDIFDKLKVIGFISKKGVKSLVKCQCECGKIHSIVKHRLLNNKTNSCGCQKRTQNTGAINSGYFNSIKKGAEGRNMEFNITIEEISKLFELQERKCALTGLQLNTYDEHKNKKNMTASLDRIDSEKGYTIDNVQWVHKKINKLKLDFTEEELYYYCKLIVEYNKNNL